MLLLLESMNDGKTIFDVAIVGYGPAGITAAIYAARKRLETLLLGDLPGGEIGNSGDIENWPGDGETDGITLAEKFTKHLELHKDIIKIVDNKATAITKDSDGFFTITTQQRPFRSKTVIYAAGRHPRLLGVPGELEFKNRGVTYCATCDAPLFVDKDVAVIGGGNSGAEAVIMLQKIARHIYLLHNSDTLRADPILIQNFEHDPKVTIIYNALASRIEGTTTVEKLVYTDAQSGTESILAVQGVFIHIGAIPNTEPVQHVVDINEFGAIPADRYGYTTVEGFFAVGDVTDIRDAQIVVAAGHGCSAALSAGDYLSRLKK